MLFRTIFEIRKRYSDADVYYTSAEMDDACILCKHVYSEPHSYMYMESFPKKLFVLARSTVRYILRHSIPPKNVAALDKVFRKADIILDVSGFALSSKASWNVNMSFLRAIEQAKRLKKQIFIMPQSFGPFQNSETQSRIDKAARDALNYPDIIFAREQEGYDLLTQRYRLQNVIKSTDIVLQGDAIDYTYVIGNARRKTPPCPEGIAIVPNIRLTQHTTKITDLYRGIYVPIIETILSLGKKAVLIRHAKEDRRLCVNIKKLFSDNENVVLLDEDLESYEYAEIASHMDLVIGSRYHSLVHALRAQIPCIAIGWAEKYSSLFQQFGLADCVFDAREGFDVGDLTDLIKCLNHDREAIRSQIGNALRSIQKSNCFDAVAKAISTNMG